MIVEPYFKSLFILEPKDYGWIVERLMRDIANELSNRGVVVNIGGQEEYNNEEIVLHSRYLSSVKIKEAKINSLWVTHIDDYFKIKRIKTLIPQFESIINMSPDDDNYLRSIYQSDINSIGINLPSRSNSIYPLRFAIFSACYPDGRKNEKWIAEFCSLLSPEKKKAVQFTFLGWGWGESAKIIDEYGINYEIVSFGRETPNEYAMYKEKLVNCDILLYAGFDGGSMSFYDGMELGLELIMPNISYHMGAQEFTTYFENKSELFELLDARIEKHIRRLTFLKERSIIGYCDTLIRHWNKTLGYGDKNNSQEKPVKIINREIYQLSQQKLNFDRFRSSLIRLVSRYKYL